MKDEIKEMLDDLLFTTTLPNVSIKLNEEKINQLKDYITNLQQENEKLKKLLNCKEYFIDQLTNNWNELKELCEIILDKMEEIEKRYEKQDN